MAGAQTQRPNATLRCQVQMLAVLEFLSHAGSQCCRYSRFKARRAQMTLRHPMQGAQTGGPQMRGAHVVKWVSLHCMAAPTGGPQRLSVPGGPRVLDSDVMMIFTVAMATGQGPKCASEAAGAHEPNLQHVINRPR